MLSGVGVGTASVVSADWVDDRTARYQIAGRWGIGPVDVSLRGGSLEDRAGNPVRSFTSRFALEGSLIASLELSSSQVNAGGAVQVVVRNAPADPADRVALYEVGAGDDNAVAWLLPERDANSARCRRFDRHADVPGPWLGGLYEFRLFSHGQRLTSSRALLVTGVEIFLDFDGGYLADLPGVVEVNGSTGRSHPAFTGYGSESIDVQIGHILDDVRTRLRPVRRPGHP